MNLPKVLQLKYPNADFMKDIILADYGEGNGPEIQKWNLLDPKPTQSDIDAWTVQFAQQYTFNQNKIANQPIYDQLDTIDLKSIRALREGDTTRITALTNQAITLRATLLAIA